MTTLADPLQRDIARMNELLAAQGACLMGSAVHPWMDPDADSRLWPFEDAPIYQALDRIFGCHGHGWFNLQSAHLNLPFANDEEFARPACGHSPGAADHSGPGCGLAVFGWG